MPSDAKFPTPDLGERAVRAHYGDGHQKGCSPACAVEISLIKLEMQQLLDERDREIVEVALPTAWDLATDRCTSQACDNPWGPDEPPCRRCVAHELRKILGVES